MALKRQVTSFDRTEEFDSLLATWKRKIKPNNIMNISTSVTTTTTGNVTLISTVIGSNEEVYVYGLRTDEGVEGTSINLQVDGTTVWTLDSNGNQTMSNPDAPLAVVQASSTIALTIFTVTTDDTFAVSAVGKIEPLPTSVEPQLAD